MTTKDLTAYTEAMEKERQQLLDHLKSTKMVKDVWDNSITAEQQFLIILRYNLTRFNPRSGKRSNWTYNVAHAMMLTCELMQLEVSFEEMGRHDAVIRDPRSEEIVFFAEWEWDYPSIIGKAGEVGKLFRSVDKESDACAILFSYCHREKFSGFLTDITTRWQDLIKKHGPDAPPLFLIIGLIDKAPKDQQEFIPILRTVCILKDAIDLYDDFYI
jgi:hypothetical protein